MNRKIMLGFKAIFTKILSLFFSMIFKLKENKVLFISDARSILGSNLKFVYDSIDKNKFEKIVDLKEDRRNHRGVVKYIKTIYSLTTSKYIILEDFVFYIGYMHIRKNQEIVQLWHALGAFKKFGYSRNDLKNIDKGYKRYTKVITSSKNINWCYAEAFGIMPNKVQATGVPRTDMFFDMGYIKSKKEEIYLSYPNINKKKVILFAPTYRGASTLDAYYDFDKLDLDEIFFELKDDYIFVFKWHPAIYKNMQLKKLSSYNLDKYNGFYIDMSNKKDINDLLLVTDILITDYSSVIFDYFFLNKPIIYYTYDLKEYVDGRGLYFPFKDYLYGDIASNTKELICSIKNGNLNTKNREQFKQQFIKACDGKSTEKTCNWIFDNK